MTNREEGTSDGDMMGRGNAASILLHNGAIPISILSSLSPNSCLDS